MQGSKYNIKISRMTVQDIMLVEEMEQRVYGEHHWSRESFFNELSNELAKYYCVCDENNRLIAYAGCWQILEEAHITTIAVDTEFRRKKIGEALLNKIIEDCHANGIKYITLEVRVSNTPAIKLYEKYGFQSLGTRKGYYQDNNEDALIMWTENIFWDKFKEVYNENTQKLNEVISIL